VYGSVQQVQSASPGGEAAAGGQDAYSSKNAQSAESIAALFRERTEGPVVKNYPIGPGDVLEVSVPPIDELNKLTTRVEADGTISLPMLGTLRAAGLTQQQLCAELRDKLKTYMYKPDVEVFVKQYNSREVAVVGAVNRPGLITLSAPNETVLDMLTSAGGITPTAADEVILLPVEYSSRSAAGRIAQVSAETPAPADGLRQGAEAAALPSRGAFKQNEASALLRQNSHPLIIPLKSSALTGSGGYLNMPVRPGDVLMVPGGGEVMVVGWVQHPGHFEVGSGLTVLGAIGAAGGPMYAADTTDIHLVRTRRDGSKLVLRMNLSKIKDGTEADLPVRGNDVIDVPYSDLKIGPYVFYSILTRVGVGAPIPAP
jgi:polysaccharide biosynthesis/export protein